jgi:hypothetical protein
MSYVKLFGSILASTIWRESATTCKLWITMLALADRDGLVEGSVPGLADLARLDVKTCHEALAILLAPDPDSRTKTDEGRRIQEVPGGWLITNYEFYRDKQSADAVREAARLRQQRKRERDSSRLSPPSPSVTPSGSSDLIAAPEEKRASRALAVARPDSVSEAVWRDFLALRANKRAKLTPTAWMHIVHEANKAGWTLEAALTEAVARGWAGFKAEWVKDKGAFGKPLKPPEHPRNMPIGASANCICEDCLRFRAKQAAVNAS